MILISNVRTSVSKKIYLMALIRTLTVTAAAFERTKEKFYGFQQTVIAIFEMCGDLVKQLPGVPKKKRNMFDRL